jgi:hypothetical protein
LWTLPTTDSVVLIINRETGQWGTGYRPQNDLGRARLTTEAIPTVTEKFTIAVKPQEAQSAVLVLEWDRFRWTAPIVAR